MAKISMKKYEEQFQATISDCFYGVDENVKSEERHAAINRAIASLHGLESVSEEGFQKRATKALHALVAASILSHPDVAERMKPLFEKGLISEEYLIKSVMGLEV